MDTLTQLQTAFQQTVLTIPENDLTTTDRQRIQHEVNCCGRIISSKQLSEKEKIGWIRQMGADWNETAFIMVGLLSGEWTFEECLKSADLI